MHTYEAIAIDAVVLCNHIAMLYVCKRGYLINSALSHIIKPHMASVNIIINFSDELTEGLKPAALRCSPKLTQKEAYIRIFRNTGANQKYPLPLVGLLNFEMDIAIS